MENFNGKNSVHEARAVKHVLAISKVFFSWTVITFVITIVLSLMAIVLLWFVMPAFSPLTSLPRQANVSEK